ncbi:acyl-CoA thioesterase [Gilvibacter sediminis]|uniref:acyl-CoA thioesterase n=1 Tax=Gilvibacter sediminis TaxID=379071 RepID=UPI002350B234|nr:thioesterase family protein [Gilvibacter sediminis]MDC7996566.1 thioesterase family protein [Gilvibacter sediminis]
MTPQIFTQSITVREEHIDDRNHVNNLVYLQWCLDAAENHWTQNATTKHLQDYVWFVLKHEIEYKMQALLGEQLLIKTWVASNAGVRSERQYEIYNEQTGKLLVKAKTLWCLLKADSKKPTLIPEEICNLFIDE